MATPYKTKAQYKAADEAVDDYFMQALDHPIVSPVSASPADGMRWECPYCSKTGMPRDDEDKAFKNGWEHVKAWHPTGALRAEANRVKRAAYENESR